MRFLLNARYSTLSSVLKFVCLIHVVSSEFDTTTEFLCTTTDHLTKLDLNESTCAEMSNEGDAWKKAKSVYDFSVNNIQGEPVSLEKYKGNVLLIANVASRCGLTAKNYEQLVELDEKYKDQGLRILAFPCNQFAGQEPGSSEQICEYAKKKNVNFDMFEKVDVNGKDAHPLWKYLKMKQGGTFGDLIKWNFSKFLVNREGQPVDRFAPTTEPVSMVEKIESLLKTQ